jgi:outer membrane protein assembly factor BamB
MTRYPIYDVRFQGGFVLAQSSRVIRAVTGLLLLGVVLSACGGTLPGNWPGLAVDGDTVYAISGSPQKVYMLDAETGAQKGTFTPLDESKGVLFWSPVAVGGDLAFVGFSAPQEKEKIAALYAFDPETGQELWDIPTEEQDLIIPAPVYADGVVYFGDSGGFVYAVDVETRRVKPGWPFPAEEAIWAPVLVDGGRVYVAAQDRHLYALDAETGQVVWEFKAAGAFAAQPVLNLSRGILYVGAFDGRLYAVDADSGQPVGDFEFEAKNWIWSETLLADDLLYVTALDGNLYALDPTSGSEVAPPFDGDSPLRAAPVRAGDSVVVASQEGRVTALALATAQEKWHWPSGTPEAQVKTTPVVSKGNVYVIQMNGQVYALASDSGAELWEFAPPQAD